jgi:hypothetical protein
MRRFLCRTTAALFFAGLLGFCALLAKSCVYVDRHARPLEDIWKRRPCPRCGRTMTLFEIDGRIEAHCLRCDPDAGFLKEPASSEKVEAEPLK